MKVIRLESQFTPTELYQAKTQMKSLWFYYLKSECDAVDIYGKKEAGTGEHSNTFNQINKHK